MSYFSDQDLELIQTLVYQPDLPPGYDAIKDALIWRDEWSNELSEEGFDRLCQLWIARSFIHKCRSFSSYTIAPELLERVWVEAQAKIPKWPGFNRLELNQRDRDYYEEQSCSEF